VYLILRAIFSLAVHDGTSKPYMGINTAKSIEVEFESGEEGFPSVSNNRPCGRSLILWKFSINIHAILIRFLL